MISSCHNCVFNASLQNDTMAHEPVEPVEEKKSTPPVSAILGVVVGGAAVIM